MVSYATDYLYRSNTEAVTVTVVSTAATTAVSKAFREDIDVRRTPFSGVLMNGKELIWNIPVAQMGATTIEPGNATITDGDSVVWRVQQVTKSSVGSSPLDFVCLCLRNK